MSTTDGPRRDDTDPITPVEPTPAPPEPPVNPEVDAVRRHTSLGHTKAAATWTGLVIGVLVLVALLVFILQNLETVTLDLFWWEFSVPLGVGLLLAAIAGALIMALAGGVRIVQIRRLAKRAANAA
ncbi:lipopolysaccharide assembly protein LapA domain-containing protein [Rhodococcus sp. NPDC003318]|uniref:lipopolysaccharide assembly protein LapA domain-containing protein n=1 Tax=Rhodococcus sp. NPDC003318 TaxID=3364503 RepID=UPI0036B4F7EB